MAREYRLLTATLLPATASEGCRDKTLALLIPAQAACSLGISGTILALCVSGLSLLSVITPHDRHPPVGGKVEHSIVCMESISRVIVEMDCKCQCHTQGQGLQCFSVLGQHNGPHGDPEVGDGADLEKHQQ